MSRWPPPTPQVRTDGTGVVGADQYNFVAKAVPNYDGLRDFPGLHDMVCWALGTEDPRDSGAALFWYDSTNRALDNNSTVIAPFGTVQGRWLRLGTWPHGTTPPPPPLCNWVERTSAPTPGIPYAYGNGIAMSGDGHTIFTASPGPDNDVYRSTNDGVTWTALGIANAANAIVSVACSTDASHIVALINVPSSDSGFIISTNSGATWTTTLTGQYSFNQATNFNTVVMSGDGAKILASTLADINVSDNDIWFSINSGISFSSVDPAPGNVALGGYWNALGISRDGSTWLAASLDPSGTQFWLSKSINNGATWTRLSPPHQLPDPGYWQGCSGIAVSSDGSRMILTQRFVPEVIVSTDSGATWNSYTVADEFGNVACSDNGLIALSYGTNDGFLYESTDGGQTWAKTCAPSKIWRGVAVSQSGAAMTASDTVDVWDYPPI